MSKAQERPLMAMLSDDELPNASEEMVDIVTSLSVK